MDERSAKLRLTGAVAPDREYVDPSEQPTPEDGVPVYVGDHGSYERRRKPARENSRALARAAIEQADVFMRARANTGLTDEFKNTIASFVGDVLDERERQARRKEKQPGSRREAMEQRAFIGWLVAAILFVALFLGTLGLTWNRIAEVEDRQASDEKYQMIVANWLVTDADQDYNRAVALDAMLRIIATQVGADVSRVAPPTRTDPPTAVQRKNNDYHLSKGE